MIEALAIEGLAVERGERRLFSGLDLALRAGEAAALTGANGAGKTSLLRAVAGLLRPAAGTIRFEGADGPLEAEDARSAGMHLLGHHDGLKTTRTAGEELAFWAAWLAAAPGFPLADRQPIDPRPLGEVAPQGPEGAPERSALQPPSSAAPTLPPRGEDLLDNAIDRLQLRPLLGLDVRRLSAGQRRRLALARLVASPRPLWLLDEPLAPLDASQRERFGALMAEHLARGGLILAAVHDPLPVPTRAVTIGAAP